MLREDVGMVLKEQLRRLLAEKEEKILDNKKALGKLLAGQDDYQLRDVIKKIACKELSGCIVQPTGALQTQVAEVLKVQQMLEPESAQIPVAISKTQVIPREFAKIICFLSRPADIGLDQSNLTQLQDILEQDQTLTKQLFQSVVTADGALALLIASGKTTSLKNDFQGNILMLILSQDSLYGDEDLREIVAAAYMKAARKGIQLPQSWSGMTNNWSMYLKWYQKNHWNDDFSWECPKGDTPAQQVQNYRAALREKRAENISRRVAQLDLTAIRGITWINNSARMQYFEQIGTNNLVADSKGTLGVQTIQENVFSGIYSYKSSALDKKAQAAFAADLTGGLDAADASELYDAVSMSVLQEKDGKWIGVDANTLAAFYAKRLYFTEDGLYENSKARTELVSPKRSVAYLRLGVDTTNLPKNQRYLVSIEIHVKKNIQQQTNAESLYELSAKNANYLEAWQILSKNGATKNTADFAALSEEEKQTVREKLAGVIDLAQIINPLNNAVENYATENQTAQSQYLDCIISTKK